MLFKEWFGRPRCIYAGVFIWISITGGRFLAPFLEHEANLSEQEIGITLAAQQCVSTFAGSLGGQWADRLERRYPAKGRAIVLSAGTILGSIAFLLHGMHQIVSEAPFFQSFLWHTILRCVYAISTSLVFPVMDGMTISFLQKQPGDYGKERLYGAISWAVTHLAIAPLLDVNVQNGFSLFYPAAIASTIGLALAIYLHVHLQNANHHRPLKQRNSDLFQPENTEQSNVDKDMTVQDNDDDMFATEHLPDNDGEAYEDQQPRNLDASTFSLWSLLKILGGTTSAAFFLFALFCLAFGQVVVESLVFLFFEFLGSSYTMMGGTVLLTVAFEIPIFHIAPKLLEWFGTQWLLLCGAFCYIVRVVGYSVVPMGHVYLVLFFEPLHGVTYACVQTASVEFASRTLPQGYEATGQGLISMIRGFGSILGLLWGGIGAEMVGPRFMYRVSATVVLLGCSPLAMLAMKFSGHDIAISTSDNSIQGEGLDGPSNIELT